MSWISRTAIRTFLAGTVGATVLALPAPAQAAPEEYVKYYTVTSAYNSAPENLTEIANRFLGSGARSAEIFNLNIGRRQPDGRTLSDPAKLRAGWMLVMPWDAVGGGIQYGVLPTPAPAPKTTTKGPGTGQSTPPGTGTGTGGATPPPPFGQAVPAPGSRPSAPPAVLPGAPLSVSGSPAAATGCSSAAASSSVSDWARSRLDADQAWPQSRGKGQLVAIVDSGVNGALPQLTGHVSVGVEAANPKLRGDTDCLGTGTAMAALVVAKQVKGAGPVGAAPDATVMPVRVVTNQPVATPEVQVKAIEAAVSQGATVIALGAYLDPNDTKVARAIGAAVARNIVVVLAAPLAAKPVNEDAVLGEGALRVAGVAVDGKWGVDYRKGTVDVSAPGVEVSSLSNIAPGTAVNGSGTHYAIAFAAAEAALVRSAYPDLNAQQVTHRIKVTSDMMGEGEPPHSQFGWGMLNPAKAVTAVLAEEAQAQVAPSSNAPAADSSTTADPSGSGTRTTVLIVTAILMIAAALLLGHRIRRLLRKDDEEDFGGGREPEIDLYDPRFQTPPSPPVPVPPAVPMQAPAPAPVPAPVLAASTANQPPVDLSGRPVFDDGGDAHWSKAGGHWSDDDSNGPARH